MSLALALLDQSRVLWRDNGDRAALKGSHMTFSNPQTLALYQVFLASRFLLFAGGSHIST